MSDRLDKCCGISKQVSGEMAWCETHERWHYKCDLARYQAALAAAESDPIVQFDRAAATIKTLKAERDSAMKAHTDDLARRDLHQCENCDEWERAPSHDEENSEQGYCSFFDNDLYTDSHFSCKAWRGKK